MKRLLVIVFTSILMLVLSLSTVNPVIAISWGEPDTEHTNVGAVVVDFNGDSYPVCSGVLIHERLFITAAHCTAYLENYDIEDIHVNFENDALNSAGFLNVEEIITHPNYTSTNGLKTADVGILVLEAPVTDITTATLTTEGLLEILQKDGKLRQGKEELDFTVVGYGGTLAWPPPSITYEDIRQSAISEYLALLKSWLILSQNQATGDGGTCYGDSGGPVFYDDPENGEILVAITSWGDARCVATGICYRVDTPSTLSFIADVEANLD